MRCKFDGQKKTGCGVQRPADREQEQVDRAAGLGAELDIRQLKTM